MLIFFLSCSGQSQPVQLVSSRPSGQAGGAGGGGLPVGIEADAHLIVYNPPPPPILIDAENRLRKFKKIRSKQTRLSFVTLFFNRVQALQPEKFGLKINTHQLTRFV